MRKKNYKGRRITRKLSKCLTVFKASLMKNTSTKLIKRQAVLITSLVKPADRRR